MTCYHVKASLRLLDWRFDLLHANHSRPGPVQRSRFRSWQPDAGHFRGDIRSSGQGRVLAVTRPLLPCETPGAQARIAACSGQFHHHTLDNIHHLATGSLHGRLLQSQSSVIYRRSLPSSSSSVVQQSPRDVHPDLLILHHGARHFLPQQD
jgi:hypothetical protein